MKKILIITNYFAPENVIASIRPAKLAKYLNLAGYHVSVITNTIEDLKTKDPLLERDLKYVHNLIRVSYHNRLSESLKPFLRRLKLLFPKRPAREKNKKENKKVNRSAGGNEAEPLNISRIKIFTAIISFYLMRIRYYFYAKKIVSSLNGIDYDIVISTYGKFLPHLIAATLKAERKSKLKWIADFRDPVYSPLHEKYLERLLRGYFNKVSKEADAITAVSKGIFDMHKDDMTQKGYVITNGYDRDDIKSITPFDFQNQKINFVYTGTIYKGTRDFLSLFKATRDFIESGIFDVNDLAVHYAGRDFNDLKEQASHFGMEQILHDHGFVAREKSLSMQLGADILLLASWNFTGYTGVITGKFLEYMMMDKPILSVITGDIPNSEIKEIMQNANNGLCYEEAAKNADYAKLKDFLLASYKGFKGSGSIPFNPNREYIDRFFYKNIAKQFSDLF